MNRIRDGSLQPLRVCREHTEVKPPKHLMMLAKARMAVECSYAQDEHCELPGSMTQLYMIQYYNTYI